MRNLLPLALLLAACGGSNAPSVPPQLVLPIPPGARMATASCPKTGEPSIAPVQRPVTMRPPATHVPVPPAVQALVDAADRSEDDKKLDAGRHPGELLAFLGLKPGDRVAELGAGGGYTTELLARAVGPRGRVWGVNNAFIMKFAEKPWGERLKKPGLKNVVRVDKEFDAPLPPDAKNLDAVVINLFYHDTVWMGVDRDKMNKAIFDSLRHGGQYVIVDHSAPEGSGTEDVKTTHRIDELFVIRDVERVGFHHAGSADFLRNQADTRDWNDSPRESGERRGTSDRFVLRFIKP
ncbi:MAG TPA: SAM-dependent methyltransferase [Polyangiaceae bacterium]